MLRIANVSGWVLLWNFRGEVARECGIFWESAIACQVDRGLIS